MHKDAPFSYQTIPLNEQMGALLRTQRKYKRLSQGELARRAGTTQRIVAGIELATYNPSLQLIRRLFDELDYDLIVQARRKLGGQ